MNEAISVNAPKLTNGVVDIHLLQADNKLPLVIEPATGNDAGVDSLINWIAENHSNFDETLFEHGAMLFRNFNIKDAWDFEKIALKVDPGLKNDYLGTSPRNLRTNYVFSASELPGYYPISQHIEMSFLKNHPRHLFFYCSIEPKNGGETPIVDFRKVYAKLNPQIREEFIQKGVKYVRNYEGPETKSKFDLWKLKRWDEMFMTTDKQKVEEICKKNDIRCVWKEDGRLALINEMDATKKHPVTGEPVWFNHLQVFHRNSAAIEYSKVAAHQKNIRSYFFKYFLSAMTSLKNGTDSNELSLHCQFRDGSEIPKEYVQHVEDVIWDNMVIFKWKKGDVIAIDNYSTSHGRLPYTGEREVLVCWST